MKKRFSNYIFGNITNTSPSLYTGKTMDRIDINPAKNQLRQEFIQLLNKGYNASCPKAGFCFLHEKNGKKNKK